LVCAGGNNLRERTNQTLDLRYSVLTRLLASHFIWSLIQQIGLHRFQFQELYITTSIFNLSFTITVDPVENRENGEKKTRCCNPIESFAVHIYVLDLGLLHAIPTIEQAITVGRLRISADKFIATGSYRWPSGQPGTARHGHGPQGVGLAWHAVPLKPCHCVPRAWPSA
jgi:hypothetical protein